VSALRPGVGDREVETAGVVDAEVLRPHRPDIEPGGSLDDDLQIERPPAEPVVELDVLEPAPPHVVGHDRRVVVRHLDRQLVGSGPQAVPGLDGEPRRRRLLAPDRPKNDGPRLDLDRCVDVLLPDVELEVPSGRHPPDELGGTAPPQPAAVRDRHRERPPFARPEPVVGDREVQVRLADHLLRFARLRADGCRGDRRQQEKGDDCRRACATHSPSPIAAAPCRSRPSRCRSTAAPSLASITLP
jgi:hypothetical protein